MGCGVVAAGGRPGSGGGAGGGGGFVARRGESGVAVPESGGRAGGGRDGDRVAGPGGRAVLGPGGGRPGPAFVVRWPGASAAHDGGGVDGRSAGLRSGERDVTVAVRRTPDLAR
ncbi:hypothetical protein CBQ26_20730 [Deinococcus indicus]|uniref:Uncharacterized protein n=1 Tax=Deinococcus indicus TaxID=223556 RepID=A0A246BDL8_9DEIO|nr:hypothetical protein CBQ26_20730 [Deinococcus indicus]